MPIGLLAEQAAYYRARATSMTNGGSGSGATINGPCIDASPETIAINLQRIADAQLPAPTYIEADLFAWRPPAHYDVVFFSFCEPRPARPF